MKLSKIVLLAGAIGLLLWLTRRRDRDIEYPEVPEPPQEWWKVSEYFPWDYVTVVGNYNLTNRTWSHHERDPTD